MKDFKIYLENSEEKKYIACLMYAGIAKYKDKNCQNVLINKYIDDIAKSFIGSPVVDGHNQPKHDHDPIILGRVENVFCNGDGFALKDGTFIKADGKYYCEFTVFDEKGVDAIKKNGFVSTSYLAEEVIEPKNGEKFEYINVPYDVEIKSIKAMHLALVSKPRYEDATIYENQKENIMEHESKIEIEKGVFVSFFSSTAEKGKELLSSIFNNSKKKENEEEAKDNSDYKEEKEEKKENKKKKDNSEHEEKKDNEDGDADSGKDKKDNKCNSDEMENEVDVDGEKVSMENLKKCWANSKKKNNSEEETKDNSKEEESLDEIEAKSFNNSKSEKQYIIGISGYGYNNFFNKK
jgi:hypothetical protein